jgi:hypothetical protein
MKNKSRINDLDDLEKELSRLRSRMRVNRSAMNQQWVKMKGDFVKLSWGSLKAAFGFRSNKGASGQSNELTSTLLNILLKWIGKLK